MFIKASREGAGLVVSCIGGAAILSMVSPTLLTGAIGLFLLGGALIAAVLVVITEVRRGVAPLKSILGVGFIALLTFALTWAPMLYFQHMLASGQPLFRFGQ